MDLGAFEAVQAAQDAAYWAAVAASAAWVIGLASLAVTAGGLVFIWRQLKVAEISADAARQAAEVAFSAERAWIKISVSGGRVVTGADQFDATIHAKFQNVGRMPAVDFHVLNLVSGSGDVMDFDPAPELSAFLPQGQVIWPGSDEEIDVRITLPPKPLGNRIWVVMLVAYYRLGDEKTYRRSALAFYLSATKFLHPHDSLYPNYPNLTILADVRVTPTQPVHPT